ncbi:MAG: type II toxin-antitoxin system VapC family toxin [Candidatus Competibacter sp.]|nr:type II toxin-antitoxin system VapC family toxin [Candidatus Competibacteraceae bacterium]MBL8253873.1 type II toxin-antitoxin system VapC family toxin [Candidatus Competibacter sp.]
MRLLLDTCTFLWIVSDAPELSTRARELFAQPENEVFLSVVSVWEIVVKHQLGKLPLSAPPRAFVAGHRERHRIAALPLEEEAIFPLSALPNRHGDPFDRMLVCQAIYHGFTLLTPDPLIQQYPVAHVW